MLLSHARVIIDRISHDAAHSQEAAKANGRSLLSGFPTLQVSHQHLFKLADGVVMDLNQMGKVSDTATDMHGSGRIWNLDGIEDGLDTWIGLELLRDTHDDEGAGVEGEDVFRRAEKLRTKAHHSGPMKPDDDYDDSRDNINHANMGPEIVSSDVTNGQHGEGVA